MDNDLVALVKDIRTLCEKQGLKLVTAESCSGGLIAAAVTAVAGAADFFERGFVSYSNEAKIDLLDIPEQLLKEHGAVSRETAVAMAEGALKNSRGHISVSVTGIAGPTGATETKPLGRVHIAVARKNQQTAEQQFDFGGIGRENVQKKTVEEALKFIRLRLQDSAAL